MGSDSSHDERFGKNAQGQRRLTRFKMESLSFNALSVAMRDSAARVRMEDLYPAINSTLCRHEVGGWFLKDQCQIHFSKNLTCIIGGRRGWQIDHASNHFVLEAAMAPDNTLVDSEVWPDCISLSLRG